MKRIEAALHSIDGYLISITRDTVNGWYELQIGLPVGWVYDENEKIECEIMEETNAGVLIRVAPKTHEIVIDDLISFVQIIIKTNEKIAQKEKQFTDKMEVMKGLLEQEAKKFYKELDELRERSFKDDNENFVTNLDKPKRGRPKKTTARKTEEAVNPEQKPKQQKKKEEKPAVTEETVDVEPANE